MAIAIIPSTKHFPNFTVGTMGLYKYYFSLKNFLQQGIYNPELYEDLFYKLTKILENPNFSDPFKTVVNLFKKVRYDLNLMRQTACLVFNPIMVDRYNTLFSYTPMV